MRSRGQASVEYLGVVALLAALVVAFGAVTGGEAVGAAFVRQFHRALCIVRGGECELDRAPCTVESLADSVDEHVTFRFLRVGRSKLVLMERLSDGRVRVTVVRDVHAGVEGGAGTGGWLDEGDGVRITGRGVLRAAVLAKIGSSDTYLFGDAVLADSGLAALAGGHEPGTGRRVEHESLTGFGATLDAAARQGFGALRADLVAATATDEATGRTTVVLKAAASGDGLIDVDGREATARLAGDERVAVTLDPDGRPLDLVVARTGEVGGSIDLPLSLRAKPLPQTPHVDADVHRRWVVERHLDLTDPDNLAAAGAYVARVRAREGLPSPPPHVTAGLRRRLSEHGLTDVRTYDLDAESHGFGAQGGSQFGGAYGDRQEKARLVAARQRGPDGVWRERTDCLEGGPARLSA